MGEKNHKVETELSRDLGFISALAIGVGTMIAAGIFTLSGLAIRNVGSAAIVSFLLAAIVSLFTALTYCEFTSIYPRSGEGYLYARKTFSPPLAYFVGWSLFLGYTSSCSFYIASLSSYFVEFVYETPFISISGLVSLVLLMFLNIKGTKESGSFQVIVTIAKIILLMWFVIGGLKFVNNQEIIDKFSNDMVEIVSTSALVFITFFGFSAIAASAGEVKNPVKNIPKAIFWAMGIVTVLYILVVLVTIAANLTEYSEAAMGTAANMFLGPIGGMIIVAGAIFSMISASNASIMAGSRVTLAMSQLGHFPKEFGAINNVTRTPIIAISIVCGAIALFALSLPLEDLAHFADTVLLLALILVNAALIVHRKKYPDIHRPFRVPLVPLLPILGILANFYLLLQIFHHVTAVVAAFVSLLLGMVGFLSWKSSQHEEEVIPGSPSKLAFASYSQDDSDKSEKIIIPVANPSSIPQLIKLGASISKEKNASLIILKVAIVNEQMPLDYDHKFVQKETDVLNLAIAEAAKYGVKATSLLKIGYNPARAILETARERKCKLMILGWKGFSSSRERILGQITDTIVTYARCDLMLVKLSKKDIGNIILPSAGGEHARSAEIYSAIIAKELGKKLSICHIETGKEKNIEDKPKAALAQDRIKEYNGLETDLIIVKNSNIIQGILEAAKPYDTIVVGATRDSIYQQIMFGSIPEAVAKDTEKNVIVIKHYHRVKALMGRVLGE